MKVNIMPGKYVLAVSGGVDSMALMDILAKKPEVELIVAHFNHGTREDSINDELLVAQMAKNYSLPLETGHGKLGPNTNENEARIARYRFLNKVKKQYSADAIITAHHQDDLIETALLNILRGTHRKGLSSIRNASIKRPLLDVPKKEILAYAKKKKLLWHEDKSNQDLKYLRNYLRNKILLNLTIERRTEVLSNLDKVAKLNVRIDSDIATLSHVLQDNILNRQTFVMLPAPVAEELMGFWLRNNNLGRFDAKTIKRLSTSVKTGIPGTNHAVYEGWYVKLEKQTASLTHP